MIFKASALSLATAVLFVSGILWPFAGTSINMKIEEKVGPEDRVAAKKLMDEGNYRDSLALYLKLARNKDAKDSELAEDWSFVVQNLQNLQQVQEFDNLLEEFHELHLNKPRFQKRLAMSLLNFEHYGFTTAGKFYRGSARGSGVWTSSQDRDRVRALQIMLRAEKSIKDSDDKNLMAEYYWELSQLVSSDRMYGETWKLQELTILETLPDYEPADQWGWGGRGWGGGVNRGAPVDAEGNPIFYKIPESWEKAVNDGERWRWSMEQSARLVDSYRHTADWTFASFLQGQFGVQTMAEWGAYFRPTAEDDGESPRKDNPFAVSTLSDEETIAKLATGVKRFTLPDEFNPIKWFQKIAKDKASYREHALGQLAQVFEDRQQYPRAAKLWQQLFDETRNETYKLRLEQVVKPWGRFENANVQPAGKPTSVEFRFRNGKNVALKARKIKVEELLKDTIAYLKSNPRELDWQRVQIESVAYYILQQNMQKYVGAEVAAWQVPLEPRAAHFDRRITISTPLQNSGSYLVTAKLEDGNESNIVLFVEDTVLMRKPVNGKYLYYVGDAVTGMPVPNANVEFFGWAQRWDDQGKRTWIDIGNFAEISDKDGFVEAAPELLKNDKNWIAIARGAGGRLALIGFNSAWIGNYSDTTLQGLKVYGITDRPIYRPAQAMKFKFWVRQTSYSPIDQQPWANKPVVLKLLDPQGVEVARFDKQTDEFAGVDGEYTFGEEAALGVYTLLVSDAANAQIFSGQVNFRIEEYKKPEFEVVVTPPEKPTKLGDKIPVKIEAKYYFGGAVQEGTVKYKVHRTKKDQRWYPIRPWDWLYGNGYGWFCGDYDWYPGFKYWGCRCPTPPWWGYSADPPELVIDAETKIGPNGIVEFEIDTALAKEIHGDSDHEYSITAEVVDSSRRTIVGSGSVVVARRPFAVYVWIDRGYAQVGDAINVEMKARTADGKGVVGKGKLSLFKITYDKNGVPTEDSIQTWDVNTDEEGDAKQLVKATEAGQFRLAYSVTNDAGETIEGGHLFNVIGAGFDSANFRYNDLEILLDKSEYVPGDKVRLLINTNRAGAHILLWIRPIGVYAGRPIVLQAKGKTATYEIDVAQADMPNFFVEATTIFDAKVHQVVKEVIVPPMKKVVNVKIEPSESTVVPGKETKVKLTLTDVNGRPFTGSVVMTMYDRAVEYISGGSNVTAIREFFWNWKRGHSPQSEHNLSRVGTNIIREGMTWMADLGVFGNISADVTSVAEEASFAGGLGGGGGGPGGGGRSVPGAPMATGRAMANEAKSFAMDAMADKSSDEKDSGGAPPDLVAPTLRTQFADAAYWNVALKPDSDGVVEATITMPENLTSWKIRTWALGNQTDVGEGTVEIKTAKNIMVRLQAPRFFVERDEIVLSAVVHNYLQQDKSTKVVLNLDGNTLNTSDPLEKTVEIKAGGETRVDWRVKVAREGEAQITMSALTDVESDAMQMKFPVFVHGMLKTDSFSGVVRDNQPGTTFTMTVPSERRPEQTRLEVRYSPTLAGAMVDALPYLVDFPYGCTEQTLNRFVPTVITYDILKRMNLDLQKIREKQTNLNAQEIGDDRERAKRWGISRGNNPVFDPALVELMTKTGIKDLTAMQCSDGGWGWFSGYGERSWPHTTATVVHGLQLAKQRNIGIVPGVLERGVAWLQQYQDLQVALLIEGDRLRDLPRDKWPAHPQYRDSADNLDALIYMILLEADVTNPKMGDYLFRDRTKLSLYGLGLVGLAFDKQQSIERRDMVIKNLDQFVKYDEENQTAFIDLPNQNYWWYWYGNHIEANAYYLKLLSRVNPQDPKAAGLVKYLLNNRRNATYWSSTRDTAICIEALAEFMDKSGEVTPNMTVEVLIDGQLKQSVEITPEVLFQFDNSFVIEGADLADGKHQVEIRRKGKGNVYANAYLTNFTLEDDIAAAGLEIKVARKFYRLEQIKDAETNVAGSRGQVVGQKVEKYKRVPLKNWDEVKSGDQVEIELEIDSKNDYEYVVFEDMKVSGFEPVELRSGYVPGSLNAYVEFRDERVAFFTRQLAQGKHSFSYRMRAEIPGRFSALPTKAWAMYAPELKANSSEMKIAVKESESTADTREK